MNSQLDATMKTTPSSFHRLAGALACTLAFTTAHAQAPALPAWNTTPDRVETSIGTLEYRDGAPSKETVAKPIGNIREHVAAVLLRPQEYLAPA